MASFLALLAALLAAPAAASEPAWAGAAAAALSDTAGEARAALGTDPGFESVFRDDGAPSADRTAQSQDPARLRVTAQRVFTLIGGQRGAPDYDITLLVDQRSPWTGAAGRAMLKEGLVESATIFAQCGVNLRRVYLVEAWLDDDMRGAFVPGTRSPYLPPPEVAVATHVLVASRPLVLLTEEGSARAFNKTAAEQFARQHPVSRNLLDVATLSWSVARDYDRRFFVQPSFSLMAHELAHLFGNFGHVVSPAPNLMNSYEGGSPQDSGRAKTGDLLPAQCADIAAYRSRQSVSTTAAAVGAFAGPMPGPEFLELIRSLEH